MTDVLAEAGLDVLRVGKGKPELWVIAGVHGDEVEGIACVEDALSTITPTHGTLVGVPVAHPAALLAGTRRGPDGVDLNRTYPGRPDGGATESIGWQLWQLLTDASPAAILTLHSWSRGGLPVPHVEYSVDDPRGRELASTLGLPFIVAWDWEDGVLPKSATAKGIPSVELELGGLGAQTTSNLERGLHAIRAAAGWLGMLEAQPVQPVVDVRRIDITSSVEGRVRQLTELGTAVETGTPLFELRDHAGRILQTVSSPVSGWVALHTHYGWARPGDWTASIFEELT